MRGDAGDARDAGDAGDAEDALGENFCKSFPLRPLSKTFAQMERQQPERLCEFCFGGGADARPPCAKGAPATRVEDCE